MVGGLVGAPPTQEKPLVLLWCHNVPRPRLVGLVVVVVRKPTFVERAAKSFYRWSLVGIHGQRQWNG